MHNLLIHIHNLQNPGCIIISYFVVFVGSLIFIITKVYSLQIYAKLYTINIYSTYPKYDILNVPLKLKLSYYYLGNI